MVEGIYSVGYNPYSSYYKYNDDFLAQSYFNNNNSVPEVSFTGSKNAPASSDKDEESSNNSALWTVLFVAGAFLTGKYFNKIKGFFSKGSTPEVLNKANRTLNKAKDKVEGVVTQNKKQRIKNTSSTGAANTVTNSRESEIINNIDTRHVNSNTRKNVEDSLDSVVTPSQQADYDAQIAYRPMSQKQNAANSRNNTKNAKERADKNSIANNSKGGEKLEAVSANTAKAEQTAVKIADGAHVYPENKNTYFTKNGKVTKIILANGNKEVTDPLKIAKHLNKHNIQIETFANISKKKLNVCA